MIRIRPLHRDDAAEVELIARRMRETLMEVIGPQRGAAMYTMEWLADRVRFHVDPARSDGEVFVAVAGDEVLGHTIVRVEEGEGYFSTFYVVPEARRRKVGQQLLAEGEAWMRGRGMRVARTNTAQGNAKLQNMLFAHGYEIVERTDEMVSLTRTL